MFFVEQQLELVFNSPEYTKHMVTEKKQPKFFSKYQILVVFLILISVSPQSSIYLRWRYRNRTENKKKMIMMMIEKLYYIRPTLYNLEQFWVRRKENKKKIWTPFIYLWPLIRNHVDCQEAILVFSFLLN